MSDPQHTELLGPFDSATYRHCGKLRHKLRTEHVSYLTVCTGKGGLRSSSLPTCQSPSVTSSSDSRFPVGLPEIEKKFVSSDGTVRYLLAFADGQSVETVWMPEGDGGEAGDGSEVGDDELADLHSARHPDRGAALPRRHSDRGEASGGTR